MFVCFGISLSSHLPKVESVCHLQVSESKTLHLKKEFCSKLKIFKIGNIQGDDNDLQVLNIGNFDEEYDNDDGDDLEVVNVGDIDVGYVRPHCSGFASALVQVPLQVGDEGEHDAFDGTNNDNKDDDDDDEGDNDDNEDDDDDNDDLNDQLPNITNCKVSQVSQRIEQSAL